MDPCAKVSLPLSVRYHWWAWGVILLAGCRSAPSWLAEAPLIGVQIQDDAGRRLYLPAAPKRVALAVPYAFPLWEKAGLKERIVAACYGSGEETRVFYLLCDDSLALGDALARAQADWVWVAHPAQVAGYPEAKVYVYHPTTPEGWLTHLRRLGEIYDNQRLISLADSFLALLRQYDEHLKDTRRLRVAVLLKDAPAAVLTKQHPLSTLIERAGGSVPYTSPAKVPYAVVPAESLAAALPEVILVPEGAQDAINAFLQQYPDIYSSPAIQYKRIFSVPAEMLAQPYADPLNTLYTLLYVLHPEIAKGVSASPS